MLYALYVAKLLDRAWLLSGMRPEKHSCPTTISRKYSVSTLSCLVLLLFICFKHVFLLRLLRVRTSLWVIKSFSHFRIDLFTFLLFSLDSNLLHFNTTNFFLSLSLVSALSLALWFPLTVWHYWTDKLYWWEVCVRGDSWGYRSFQFCIPFAQIISAGNVCLVLLLDSIRNCNYLRFPFRSFFIRRSSTVCFRIRKDTCREFIAG